MSYGEVWKLDLPILTTEVPEESESGDIGTIGDLGDCYELVVLATTLDDATTKNDYWAVLETFPVTATPISYLQKCVNGEWTDLAVINDSTYATIYTRTATKKQVVAFRLEFQKVLTLQGVGCYRVRIEFDGNNRYSPTLTLKEYSSAIADETVRLTWRLNSLVGTSNSISTFDFSQVEWYSQLRVQDAIFGYKKAPIEVESSRYENGYERTIKKSFREEYQLEIRKLPIALHDILMYGMLQADDIWITDYNLNNPSGTYIEKAVEVTGSYEPNYNVDKNPSVIISFVDKYNNRRKLYS